MPKIIRNFHGEHFFLSNFYPVDVYYDGILYHSTEAAFQAAKSTDPRYRQTVAMTVDPGEAKKLGRKANLRIDWEEVKDKVMLELLRKKFAPGTRLALQLDGTGDAILVEGNTWHDCYWGVCVCPRCGSQGSNLLGQLLMTVRAENRLPTLSHDKTDAWLFGNPDCE